ncbi:hypothetical protein [uncultured Methanobrevibacter sp.]|uniref:hypothetical protein n=1 Tax=uncultured Methanobrevibacter sp. TaxID=253161 RepID=UPI0026302A8C|nr:hypothetical protein [uncultured Methanobrevibacter sp.]
MSSRSATVLVIFVIAMVAFCLASVFGAMTGTITIFPNATDDSSELSNSSYNEYKTYGSEYNNDYGSYDDSSNSENNNDKQDDSSGGLLDSLKGHSNSDSSNVETTTDSGSNVEHTSDSGSSSGSSKVETTTASGDDTA